MTFFVHCLATFRKSTVFAVFIAEFTKSDDDGGIEMNFLKDRQRKQVLRTSSGVEENALITDMFL